MKKFAKLDENNSVVDLIVVGDSDATTEERGANFINHCQGTSGVVWVEASNEVTPGSTYDFSTKKFTPVQPAPSWTYVAGSGIIGEWQPPVPYPDDTKSYEWVPETQTWREVEGDHEHFNKPAYFSDF